MSSYKKISNKQLDTLFENLKPMRSKRRETFQEYTDFLKEEDLFDEENEDKYSTLDYIKDFEEFERRMNKEEIEREIKQKEEDEKWLKKVLYRREERELCIALVESTVIMYGVYKIYRFFF